MKKILAFVLVMAMVAVLGGCGTNNVEDYEYEVVDEIAVGEIMQVEGVLVRISEGGSSLTATLRDDTGSNWNIIFQTSLGIRDFLNGVINESIIISGEYRGQSNMSASEIIINESGNTYLLSDLIRDVEPRWMSANDFNRQSNRISPDELIRVGSVNMRMNAASFGWHMTVRCITDTGAQITVFYENAINRYEIAEIFRNDNARLSIIGTVVLHPELDEAEYAGELYAYVIVAQEIEVRR